MLREPLCFLLKETSKSNLGTFSILLHPSLHTHLIVQCTFNDMHRHADVVNCTYFIFTPANYQFFFIDMDNFLRFLSTLKNLAAVAAAAAIQVFCIIIKPHFDWKMMHCIRQQKCRVFYRHPTALPLNTSNISVQTHL